jgi:hypothetical protein
MSFPDSDPRAEPAAALTGRLHRGTGKLPVAGPRDRLGLGHTGTRGRPASGPGLAPGGMVRITVCYSRA